MSSVFAGAAGADRGGPESVEEPRCGALRAIGGRPVLRGGQSRRGPRTARPAKPRPRGGDGGLGGPGGVDDVGVGIAVAGGQCRGGAGRRTGVLGNVGGTVHPVHGLRAHVLPAADLWVDSWTDHADHADHADYADHATHADHAAALCVECGADAAGAADGVFVFDGGSE